MGPTNHILPTYATQNVQTHLKLTIIMYVARLLAYVVLLVADDFSVAGVVPSLSNRVLQRCEIGVIDLRIQYGRGGCMGCKNGGSRERLPYKLMASLVIIF